MVRNVKEINWNHTNNQAYPATYLIFHLKLFLVFESSFFTFIVSVQADFVKQPDVFINDGTATPFR
jgi:hypothetical protein